MFSITFADVLKYSFYLLVVYVLYMFISGFADMVLNYQSVVIKSY